MSTTLLRLAPLLALVACGGVEYQQSAQSRVLDSFPYVDCGVASPEARQVCIVPLFSQGDAAVRIFAIESTDLQLPEGGALAAGAFLVAPRDWQDPACEDGTCKDLTRYDDESDEDTLALPITFAPLVEGEYQAELTIWSNDSQTTAEEELPDGSGDVRSVWKVQLRGISRKACARVWPSFLDFGKRPVGGDFSAEVTLENCGVPSVTVGGYQEAGTGAEEMSLYESFPVYVLPGLSESLSVGWTVGPETSGGPTPVENTFSFTANAEQLGGADLIAIGNDCDASVHPSWDADGDGWTSCGGDCDDARPEVSPSAPEQAGNGRDDDCDGTVDDAINPRGSDDDGDGATEVDGDCHDADPAIGPHAVEVLDGIDNDCDGVRDDGTERVDDDGDGLSEREGDCDDGNHLVSPALPETIDGVDNDCDGVTDEGGQDVDDDADGFIERPTDGSAEDCDDGDPWVYVGAFEFCDGYDNDCDGLVDEGTDDAADGACAFLPERKEEAAELPTKKGCSSTGAGPTHAMVVLAAFAALLGRRRH
jgi:uncharacterized protein (TIGR03382 family)